MAHSLSNALRPPVVAAAGPSLYPDPSYAHDVDQHGHDTHPNVAAEESQYPADDPAGEEEEEEEGEEDVVEGHLIDKLAEDSEVAGPGNVRSIPQSSPAPAPMAIVEPLPESSSAPPGVDPATGKRKPGRPRGSKTKKSQKAFQTSTFTFPTKVPTTPGAPRKDEPTREYYDFRWKVIHLCNEFYTAAEELVNSASPHVLAQCFEGPTGMGHPLTVIEEAKRVCEFLISQAASGGGKIPDKKPLQPPPTITAPQSFSMPLRSGPVGVAVAPPAYPPPPGHYPAYGTPNPYAPSGYPTTPYYYHPGSAPPPHQYYAQPPPHPAQPLQHVQLATSPAPQIHQHVVPSPPASNQGPWSDDEVQKLRGLADRSRQLHGGEDGGEPDWDWVTSEYGASRTRHQILIKATHLGLKESTTRVAKRKRESEAGEHEGSTPAQDGVTETAARQNTVPEGVSTSSASPAIQHSASVSTSTTAPHSRYPGQLTWKSTSVAFTNTNTPTPPVRNIGTARTGSTVFRQYFPPTSS